MASGSQLSSGSDIDARYAAMDEKKRRRMISNRESARRSRMKKQKHVRDLTTEIGRFERERNEIAKAIDAKEQRWAVLQAENDVLQAEKAALTDYLENIEGVLKTYKEHSWIFRQGKEVQEPWQVHNPSQEAASASNGFRAQ